MLVSVVTLLTAACATNPKPKSAATPPSGPQEIVGNPTVIKEYLGSNFANEHAAALAARPLAAATASPVPPSPVPPAQPAREAIHELFLEHVMQQAPGYSKLSKALTGQGHQKFQTIGPRSDAPLHIGSYLGRTHKTGY